MTDTARILVTLGGLLLIGLLTETVGRRTRLPRVSLMLLFGFLFGQSLLAVQRFPDFEPYLSLVIAVTVVFELFGPILTRRALVRMGEVGTG